MALEGVEFAKADRTLRGLVAKDPEASEKALLLNHLACNFLTNASDG